MDGSFDDIDQLLERGFTESPSEGKITTLGNMK